MARNLYLNIDDTVAKIVSRIKKEKNSEITLVLPKGSRLLSDPDNLNALKNQADALGKYISILTRDEKGRQYAAQAGFEIKELDYLNAGKVSMDIAQKTASKPVEKYPPVPPQIQTAPPQVQPVMPHYEAFQPEIAPALNKSFLIENPDQFIKHPPRPKKKRNFLAFGVVAAILLVLAILFIILPQANIIVYANTQPITRNFQIKIDSKAQSVDSQQLIVPGQLINKDLPETAQFNSTGQVNVGNAAQGTVQIYNLTGKILKLKTSTTTLVAGSKTYHFAADVSNIKPTRYFAGTKNPDPASLTPPVQIIADQPGDDSNLPAGTTFQINNQVLGSLPQLLYAKNDTAIDGGTTRYRSVVSQQDLDNAKKTLTDNAINDVKQQIQKTQGLNILDSGSNFQISNISFDKNAGDQSETFNGTATVHVNALAFSASSLQNLIEQKINASLNSDQYLVTGSQESFDESFSSIDFTGGTGLLNVNYLSEIASKIDTAGIASQINGKNALEIKELLLSNPDIDAVQINFQPFWVTTVPSLSGRVKVQVQLKPAP